MNERELTEALNNAIDRLAQGYTIDDCLRDYPHLAAELRPLLEAGRTPSRARADRAELAAMRTRLDARINARINALPAPPRRNIQFPRLVAVAAVVLIIAGVFVVTRPRLDHTAVEPLITQETPSETATLTATETETATATETETATATSTSTHTPTATLTLTTTATSTITPSPQPVCVPNPPEGWVTYRVEDEEPLIDIADSFDVSQGALVQVNCLQRDQILTPGQVIYVPGWDDDNSSGSGTNNNDDDSYDDDDDDDDNDDDDDDDDDDD